MFVRSGVVMLVCALYGTGASETRCPSNVAKQAEEQASSVRDWDEMYTAYKRFGQCDDGGISEAFSDSVGRLLSTGNGALRRLLTLISKAAEFERFVIRHIDETIPVDVLAVVEKNATDHCPKGGDRLCRAIQQAARR